MKRIIIIAAITATALSAASCGKVKNMTGKGNRSQSDSTAVEWTAIKPTDLCLKPVDVFANDWMALSMGNKNESNSMTIAWGGIGELWGKHVVTVYVSSDRASKRLMDKYDYFTVTAFPDDPKCKDGLLYIGSHSYSEEKDKMANSGLTFEYTALGNPIITEGNLAIECKKIYADEFETDKLPADVRENFYSRMGLHTMYIGEIVNVWTKEMPKEEEQSDSQSEPLQAQ